MNRTTCTPSRPIFSVVAPLALLLAGAPAPAQTNVSPTNKFSWSENCGWMNWREGGSPAGAQGARLAATFLSGFVWGGNIGWINLGDGSPANGVSYANTVGADSGVNRDAATNALSGKAWGENVGWINLSGGALATPANPARYDAAARRLRGYAWGENIGWINLDDAAAFVGFNSCPADFDGNGQVQPSDVALFVSTWFTGLQAGTLAGDFDGNGAVEPADVAAFVTAWFAALTSGC